MESLSELHLGPNFDRAKYRELEEEALRNHPEMARSYGLGGPQRSRAVLKFRTLKAAVKRFAQKTKSAKLRLAQLTRRDTSNGYIPFAEFEARFEMNQKKKATQRPESNNREEQGSPPSTQEVNDVSKEDEIVSSHENRGEIWSKCRHRCNVSCEYMMPTIEQVTVAKLAMCLVPTASIDILEATSGRDVVNDAQGKFETPEVPNSVEKTFDTDLVADQAQALRANGGSETAKNAKGDRDDATSEPRKTESQTTDVQTEGEVSAGRFGDSKEESCFPVTHAQKPFDADKAERIKRRRERLLRVRRDRAERSKKPSMFKEPSETGVVAGSVPRKEESCVPKSVDTKEPSITNNVEDVGSLSKDKAAQLWNQEEKLQVPEVVGEGFSPVARATKANMDNFTARGLSDEAIWAREMAIETADAKIRRREERLLNLLKLCMEEWVDGS